MKIVLLEPLGVSEEKVNKLALQFTTAGHEFTAYNTVAADETEQLERAKNADVLIIANHRLPASVIEWCENLKYISIAFVGIDHVDVDICKARNIHISNAAGYCDDAVAELALGLTLDCLRNISRCDVAMRSSGTKAGLVGHELKGRTVGIVGTGNTGCRTAELFKAFGCHVLGYSRTQRERAKKIGVEYVSLEKLLAQSDIVSLHTPLTSSTKGLINAERIALMKPSAILINTARGGIVDSVALANALENGKLAAVGADVFEQEPPIPADHPLKLAPRTVLTPHVAFATTESLERRADIVFENVLEWMQGRLQNQAL